MLRDLKFSDLAILEDLHNKNSSFPLNTLAVNYPSKKTLLDENGKIIGFTLLHLTSEVSLILDGTLSNLVRARAIREAFENLPIELEKAGLTDTHVFIVPEDSEDFAVFLVKNFGFKKATGIALYKGI